jgi:hypothetical protein
VPDAALDKRSHASTSRWADAKRYAGYAVCDPVGQKIGSAEEVFVNQDGEPVYIRVHFALTSGATAPDKVIDELKHYDFEIISANLPEEQENKLREAFSQEG